MSTIKLLSFRIGTVAYKHVQPYLLELHQEKVSSWIIWFYYLLGLDPHTKRWFIKFSYKDQSLDHKCDRIFFSTKEEALDWYMFVFEAVFLEKGTTPVPSKKPPPPPPKPKKTIKPLEKLNKPDHLKVVKDEPPKEDK